MTQTKSSRDNSGSSKRMPVLFIGHGSPMNAIEENEFTRSLSKLGTTLPRPKAILCISAHWLTEGTWVTHMPQPKTIHDFGGFPQALFDVQYPAPGSPDLADLIRAEVKTPTVRSDDALWGLDHGTWSVLRHMYPQADIPIMQLSIDIQKPGEYHYQLGQQLKRLRDPDLGVLIVGSGNVVHNLRQISWEANVKPFDWSVEFDEWIKAKLKKRDMKALSTNYLSTAAGRLSVPTPDHYYPLLYTLGAADQEDALSFEFEGIQNGSISMRTFSLG